MTSLLWSYIYQHEGRTTSHSHEIAATMSKQLPFYVLQTLCMHISSFVLHHSLFSDFFFFGCVLLQNKQCDLSSQLHIHRSGYESSQLSLMHTSQRRIYSSSQILCIRMMEIGPCYLQQWSSYLSPLTRAASEEILLDYRCEHAELSYESVYLNLCKYRGSFLNTAHWYARGVSHWELNWERKCYSIS